jgi:2-keto-4-pentenoate hydratase
VTWGQWVDGRGALDAVAAAGALRRARRTGRTFDVLLSEEVSLSLADAYRVQDQVTALRLADGLVWLAEQLAESGRALEPGALVITGGLTSARPLEAGHRVSASFGDGRWSVEVRRSP